MEILGYILAGGGWLTIGFCVVAIMSYKEDPLDIEGMHVFLVLFWPAVIMFYTFVIIKNIMTDILYWMVDELKRRL